MYQQSLFNYFKFTHILLILAKVGREDMANGAVTFVCGDTNEKISSSMVRSFSCLTIH